MYFYVSLCVPHDIIYFYAFLSILLCFYVFVISMYFYALICIPIVLLYISPQILCNSMYFYVLLCISVYFYVCREHISDKICRAARVMEYNGI